MARGRFVSNAIMGDKKINELSDDTSRLAFTWLITTADVEGRTHGDPAMVRSLLFPRRDDISTEQMESYINEWHQARIVNWYKCNDDLWIEFPNFDKHQVNLRKDREPESNIPPLSEGTLQPYTPNLSGNLPADIRQTSGKMTGEDKLREEKRSKDKRREGGAEKAPRPRDLLFDAIAEVCGVDPATAGSSIAKVAKALKKADPPYTPEEVKAYGAKWWEWERRVDPPSIWNLQEKIGTVRQNGQTKHGNDQEHTEPKPTAQQLAAAEIINARRSARQAENG